MLSIEPELILPHRKPFLWVQRLIERSETGDRGVVEYDIPVDLEVFEGHFPGDPIFPGVLQMEAAGQACVWVALGPKAADKNAIVRLVSARDYKFKVPVRPPATLRTEVERLRRSASLELWQVRSFVDGQLVSTGSCWIKIDYEGRQ